MCYSRLVRLVVIGPILLSMAFSGFAQVTRDDDQFGPVVRTYLGYLRNEQEVVDDRASRREVSPVYYRRNSNRIRALRQMAVQIARESQNDYLPELEAVAADELRLLFERPPRHQTLKVGDVVQTRFRYLGSVRSGDTFFMFARLNPYEQADMIERANLSNTAAGTAVSNRVAPPPTSVRVRRVSNP